MPDWSSITEEIHCPLCEYNLRGLAEPRCPECGYRFEWPNLLDASHRLHPYLFEHHPERPWWSFVRTLGGGLRPWLFWRSLQPIQPVRRTRLLIYLALLVLASLLIGCSFIGQTVLELWRQHSAARAWELSYLQSQQGNEHLGEIQKRWGSIEGYLDSYYPVNPFAILARQDLSRLAKSDLAMPIGIVMWYLGTLLAFCIFEISRRRARIQRIHFVRCVAYCGDIVWMLAPAVFAILLASSIVASLSGRGTSLGTVVSADHLHQLMRMTIVAALILFAVRLYYAFRLYLRFPHAAAVVIASQLIACLITLNVLLVLSRM